MDWNSDICLMGDMPDPGARRNAVIAALNDAVTNGSLVAKEQALQAFNAAVHGKILALTWVRYEGGSFETTGPQDEKAVLKVFRV